VTTADVQRVARAYLRQPKVVLTVVPEGRRALALRAAGASGVRVTK
jgi:zinc protease